MREMKDSGIPWIGKVEASVQMTPIKYLLKAEKNAIKVGPFGSQLSGADFQNEETGFWVYNQRSVIDKNANSGTAFISEEKYNSMKGFHVRPDDILITTRGTIGKICRLPNTVNKGILHPCVIRFRLNDEVYDYELLEMIFNESDMVSRQLLYESNSTTIEVIYSETLRNIKVPVWPIEVQRRISAFLKEKCAEIDSLTSDIQSQIDTLEQYKRSVITEAVTKGLNPNAVMKDSGIEWVGEMPTAWDIHPIYYYFGERRNKNYALAEQNLLSLSYGRVIRKSIDTVGGLLPASFNTYNIVEAGDIIIRPTDLQNDKRSLRTGLVTEHGIITSAYIDLMPKENVNSEYFHYLLHAYDIQKVFYNMGNGVRQGLNYSEFSKLMVIAPPVTEQAQIVEYLDAKCKEINDIINEKKNQLEVLDEYKKSLIYEYVTGKKEVPSNG